MTSNMALCYKATCYLSPLHRCIIEVVVSFFCFPVPNSPCHPVFSFPPSVSMVASSCSQRTNCWQEHPLNISASGQSHWHPPLAAKQCVSCHICVFCLRPRDLSVLQHLNVVVVRRGCCHSTTRPTLNLFTWVPYIHILFCYYYYCFIMPDSCKIEMGKIVSITKTK